MRESKETMLNGETAPYPESMPLGTRKSEGKSSISIIVANYDKELYLREFFDSIIHNGFDHYEIIFVDDCSNDQSTSIAYEYNIHVIKNDRNRGPSYSRNRGAQVAKGDILLFCDSDIIIDKGVLSRIISRFEQNHIDAMPGCPSYPPIRDNWVGNYRTVEIRSRLRTDSLLSKKVKVWSSTMGAIKKNLFMQLNGFNENYKGADIEDFELCLRFPLDTKIIIDEDVTYHHLYVSHFDVIIKAFKRSFLLGNLNLGHKGNTYLDDNHRKASLILGLCIWGSIILSLSIPEFSWSIFIVIFLKIYHDRRLLQKSFRLKGFSFVLYTFVFGCLMAIPISFGFLFGKLFKAVQFYLKTQAI